MIMNDKDKHNRLCGVHDGYPCTCSEEQLNKFLKDWRKNFTPTKEDEDK